MTLLQAFFDAATKYLAPDAFARILAAAEEIAGPSPIKRISVRKEQRIDKPFLAARIEATLNDVGTSSPMGAHFSERMDERLGITVGPAELGELAQLVRLGGSDVRILRTQLQTILHCEVQWRGKTFIVVFNRSRNELITAYEYQAPRAPQHKAVRFPGERSRKRFGVRNVEEYDE